MKKLSTIKTYCSNIELFNTDGTNFHLDTDGLKGIFTKEEWILDDRILPQYDKQDQKEILSTLETLEVFADYETDN